MYHCQVLKITLVLWTFLQEKNLALTARFYVGNTNAE